jgi:hypothetical protein
VLGGEVAGDAEDPENELDDPAVTP